MKKILLFAALLPLLWGCAKEIDFNMVEDIRLGPALQVPIADVNLKLSDFVEEDSVFIIDPDNSMRIYYREDSIFGFSAADLLQIPDQDPTNIPLNQTLPFVQVGTALGTLAGAELDSVFFDKGFLKFEIQSPSAFTKDIQVRFTVFNATLNGGVFQNTFVLKAGQTTARDSIDIDGLRIDLTNGGTETNYLNVRMAILNPQDLPDPNTTIENYFRFTDLGLQTAYGYFGNRVERIPAGNFDFDVSGLEEFAGGLFLTNPEVSLIVRSSTGLSLDINTRFTGINSQNEKEPLDAPIFNIAAPQQAGQTRVSRFDVNRDNSNIVNFLANIPNAILYSGNIELNPNGKTANPNFISNSSQVQVDFEANVPLELRADSMLLDRTIDFSLGTGDEDTELLKELTLYFNTENAIPLDVNLDVIFINSATNDSTASIRLNLLEAAPVDSTGKSNGVSIAKNEIKFTKRQLDGLLAADKINFQARVSTTDGGSKAVRLFVDDNLRIRLASKASFNIKPNNL